MDGDWIEVRARRDEQGREYRRTGTREAHVLEGGRGREHEAHDLHRRVAVGEVHLLEMWPSGFPAARLRDARYCGDECEDHDQRDDACEHRVGTAANASHIAPVRRVLERTAEALLYTTHIFCQVK